MPVEVGMPESARSVDEFVCAIWELAATDASRGWLAALSGTAACGEGTLIEGRLTGRWDGVIGAVAAETLLLPVRGGQRAVVARHLLTVEPVDTGGLDAAGIGDVTADGIEVVEVVSGEPLCALAGAAAAVVGSADGLRRTHVEQVRARLAISYGGDEVTDDAAVEVARATSDLDAAKLQITGALSADPARARWALRQAVARARGAADRLLASSRHALNASDPVTAAWRDVHAGCRLAARILD